MDYITIMCRFLGTDELMAKIEDLISYGITNGNLEIIALIGLNSEQVFPLLQFYVDKTSDLQTAAYISAYAINVQQMTGMVVKRSQNRLSKFIVAYREFLNNL
jgi:methylaspartate ammonia-lyase